MVAIPLPNCGSRSRRRLGGPAPGRGAHERRASHASLQRQRHALRPRARRRRVCDDAQLDGVLGEQVPWPEPDPLGSRSAPPRDPRDAARRVRGHGEGRERLHGLQCSVRRRRAPTSPRRSPPPGRRRTSRLGAPPAGTPTEVYMCHGFCELGAIPFSTVADQIRPLPRTEPAGGPGRSCSKTTFFGPHRRRAPRQRSRARRCSRSRPDNRFPRSVR